MGPIGSYVGFQASAFGTRSLPGSQKLMRSKTSLNALCRERPGHPMHHSAMLSSR